MQLSRILFFILTLGTLCFGEEQSLATKDNTFSSSSMVNTFSCVCVGELTSAFQDFNNHLFDKNLVPFENKLNKLVQAIEESIKQLETNKKNLSKELNDMKVLLVETDNYIFELEKELRKSELK